VSDIEVKEFSTIELEKRKRKFQELSNKFITEPDTDQKKYPSAPVKGIFINKKKPNPILTKINLH
jgi:hypothetical protein